MGTRSVFLLCLGECGGSHCTLISRFTWTHTLHIQTHIMESYATWKSWWLLQSPVQSEEEPEGNPLILWASWESSPLPFAGCFSPNWALEAERLVGATSLQCPSSGA